jgi:hypothetical protein
MLKSLNGDGECAEEEAKSIGDRDSVENLLGGCGTERIRRKEEI